MIYKETYMTLIISERVFVSEAGERLPVASACDENGDECGLDEVVWCTAGPDENGLYAQIDMSSSPVIQ